MAPRSIGSSDAAMTRVAARSSTATTFAEPSTTDWYPKSSFVVGW
jgi:hypothetical protein